MIFKCETISKLSEIEVKLKRSLFDSIGVRKSFRRRSLIFALEFE